MLVVFLVLQCSRCSLCFWCCISFGVHHAFGACNFCCCGTLVLLCCCFFGVHHTLGALGALDATMLLVLTIFLGTSFET